MWLLATFIISSSMPPAVATRQSIKLCLHRKAIESLRPDVMIFEVHVRKT